MASITRTTAQAGQDLWVLHQVCAGRRGGFFVEVGAHDGIELSNTYVLEKHYAWKGVCIEANPESFQRLSRLRSVQCENVCIDSKQGEVEFVMDDMMGGVLQADAPRPDSNVQKVLQTTRTLTQVLDDVQAPQDMDYLSVDVEGLEERIIEGLDLSRYRFRAMTIERPSETLLQMLYHHGYLRVQNIPGLDSFLIHGSIAAEYMENILRRARKRRRLFFFA